MKVQALAGFILLLVCADPALADPAPSAPAPAPATSSGLPAVAVNDATKPVNPADDLICKRVEVTGSHLGKERVCKTRKTWAREAEDNDDQNGRDRDLIDNRGAQNVPR